MSKHDIYKTTLRRYNIAHICNVNYWAIPKCGSTSIKLYLSDYYNKQYREYKQSEHYSHIHKEGNSFKYLTPTEALNNKMHNFTFIRDPYARFISFFQDFCRTRINPAMPEFFNVSIDKCIDMIEKNFANYNQENLNPHYRSQSYYLNNFDGLLFDINDFNKIIVNKSKDNNARLTYNQIERISKIYSLDFKYLENVSDIKFFYNILDK